MNTISLRVPPYLWTLLHYRRFGPTGQNGGVWDPRTTTGCLGWAKSSHRASTKAFGFPLSLVSVTVPGCFASAISVTQQPDQTAVIQPKPGFTGRCLVRT